MKSSMPSDTISEPDEPNKYDDNLNVSLHKSILVGEFTAWLIQLTVSSSIYETVKNVVTTTTATVKIYTCTLICSPS